MAMAPLFTMFFLDLLWQAKDPRLSFKSMDRGSDGHGLPALKTHSGYVEESLDCLGACKPSRRAVLAALWPSSGWKRP